MNLMFVTGRPSSEGPNAEREAVATISGSFARRGDRVRWLCPRLVGEPVPAAPEGVEMLGAETALPPFGAVTSRLYDVPNERLLARALRDDPPELVHVHGFGGTATYLMPWLCERLGVPALIVVDRLEPLLCARGTLVDERENDCRAWADPARCTECCTTPFAGGLTPAGAFRARRLTWLGPMAPGPVVADFENRLDMLVNGLDAADRVLVRDEVAKEALRLAQLPRPAVIGIPEPEDHQSWARVYDEILGSDRSTSSVERGT